MIATDHDLLALYAVLDLRNDPERLYAPCGPHPVSVAWCCLCDGATFLPTLGAR